MKTAIIMIGLQGSGKSEFCRQNLSPDFIRVNLDTLKTRNNEQRLINECIMRQESFVVDNTNPTKAERAKYISIAKDNGYRVVGYFMQSRLQECIARNSLREGKARIPTKAIAATSNKLEMPSYTDGFDELFFVSNDGKAMSIHKWSDQNEI